MLVDWSRLKLKVLYGFAGGFYMYSIFALIFWETRRADFGVSMSHHIAALVLIVFSYLARFYFPLCDLLLATFHYIRTMPFL
jgi:ceramide synthetase